MITASFDLSFVLLRRRMIKGLTNYLRRRKRDLAAAILLRAACEELYDVLTSLRKNPRSDARSLFDDRRLKAMFGRKNDGLSDDPTTSGGSAIAA